MVIEPEEHLLAQDHSGIVHYVKNISYYSVSLYGVYCTGESIYTQLERTPNVAITCVRCAGAYG